MGHQEARGGASACAGGKLGHEMGRRKAEFLGMEGRGGKGASSSVTVYTSL